MLKSFRYCASAFLIGAILSLSLTQTRSASAVSVLQATETATTIPTLTPADVINAVNNLRLANGLNALSVHPVLMQVAALQASALAGSEGAVGHERPCGMTLGQQLLSLGFPLWGDLSQDGYRAENWVAAQTIEQVMSFWQSDDEHLNTMVSEYRSHIGVAIAVSDQIYVVLETALSTPSGQHQTTAYDILTGIPVTQTVCAGYYDGSISNYSIPVAVSTARPDGDVVHEVKYGQTLWTIADLYHVNIEDVKRLNGLVDDNIVPGWKLLIQKAVTQPAPMTVTAIVETQYPTATPYVYPTWTVTPSLTPTPNEASVLIESLQQNRTVVAALIISLSVLVAGIVGFGRKNK